MAIGAPLPIVTDLSWSATATSAEAFIGSEFVEVDSGGIGPDIGFVTAKDGGIELGKPGSFGGAVVQTIRRFDTHHQKVILSVRWQTPECTGYGPAVGLGTGFGSGDTRAYIMANGGGWQLVLDRPGTPFTFWGIGGPPCQPDTPTGFRLEFKEGGMARVWNIDGSASLGWIPVPAQSNLFAYIANHSKGPVQIAEFHVSAPAALPGNPVVTSVVSVPEGVLVKWQVDRLNGAPLNTLRWQVGPTPDQTGLAKEFLPLDSPSLLPVSGTGVQWVRLIATTDAGPSAPSEPFAVVPWQATAVPPVAVGPRLVGDPRAGHPLQALVDVLDANADPTPEVTWRWQRAPAESGPWTDSQVSTSVIRLLSAADEGQWVRATAELPDTAPSTTTAVQVKPHGNELAQILVSGQSLAIGTGGGSPLTALQPFQNLGWFDGGLQPLIEKDLESPCSAMGNGVTSLMSPLPLQIAVTRHAINATTYSGLRKGTSAYTLGQIQVAAVRALAAVEGRPYRPLGVAIIHGEADQASGNGPNYEWVLREWQEDYEYDMTAATGVAAPLPMFVCQLSSYAGETEVPLNQWSASQSSGGRIVLVGPKYMLTYNQASHLDAKSYRRLGDYYAKVIHQVTVAGKPWRPVEPESAVRSGTTIDVKFHVPVPPLVFDVAEVLAATNMGFEFVDDAKSAQVTSVAILSADTVRLTLDKTPTGANPLVKYARNGVVGGQPGSNSATGVRGNLRDSDATVLSSGDPLHNWSIQFAMPVTLAL